MGKPAVAERVRSVVVATRPNTFVTSRAVLEHCGVEDRASVDAALRRLVGELPLTRVRRGLYYKGRPTRFGPTRPSPLAVAYEICREHGMETGVGPSGYSAARALGLTTQVPAREEIAVPGRCPDDLPAVHFVSRSFAARTGLLPDEVAVLEVLREWPRFSERGWGELVSSVVELTAARKVRPEALRDAARRERHAASRSLVAELLTSLATAGVATRPFAR